MRAVILACILAVTAAAPQYYQPQYQPAYVKPVVPIVAQSSEFNSDGSFSYSYVTGDGQQVEASGYQKKSSIPDQDAEVIQGSYSYTAPDGTPISVRYIADENGFRAEGAHLPTPPPIPEAIQRSLAIIAQAEKQQPYQPTHQQPYQPTYQQPHQPTYQQSYQPTYQQSYNPYKRY